ncbi:hypothetical protein P0D29_03610 [Mycoplasmoides gallisepticum]|uniref:hypothetical protein n=1 Tax=Mycoplasmoides gallisepticum TaxID=2096 RepID=UPI002446618B|nr:hypothetical protein [Mycoplasmoides gallisepticum]WGG25405.1 hypothetical protein P0D29_03610 [Mycoplasmoides gallisepticum]
MVSVFIVASVFLITFNNTLINNQNFSLKSLNSDLSINQILYALLAIILSLNFIYVVLSIYFIYFFINKNKIFNFKKIKIVQQQEETNQKDSGQTNQELNNQSGVNS